MNTPPAPHQSYVLRVWRADARRPWRASVHIVATGESEHFADLSGLIAFLMDEMTRAEARAPKPQAAQDDQE